MAWFYLMNGKMMIHAAYKKRFLSIENMIGANKDNGKADLQVGEMVKAEVVHIVPILL